MTPVEKMLAACVEMGVRPIARTEHNDIEIYLAEGARQRGDPHPGSPYKYVYFIRRGKSWFGNSVYYDFGISLDERREAAMKAAVKDALGWKGDNEMWREMRNGLH